MYVVYWVIMSTTYYIVKCWIYYWVWEREENFKWRDHNFYKNKTQINGIG